MAEGKRYYWLKLHKDFFKSKRIKKLRSLAGGDTYTIIYLKMQLLSLEDEGCLYYTGLERTFAEELALDLDESADDVSIVCSYLQTVGLLEKLDETRYVLPFVRECIGSETDWAQRKRIQRGQSMDIVPRVSNDCPLEIDIEKEKEIELELETDNKGGKRKRFAPPSEDDVRNYCAERNNGIDAEAFIDYYTAQGWRLSNGQPLKDWKAAVRNWERRDKTRTKSAPKAANKTAQQLDDFYDMVGDWVRGDNG